MSRSATVRAGNEQVARKAEQYQFTARVPMLCECSDPARAELVLISLDEFWQLPDGAALTAPGHPVEGASPNHQHACY